MRGFPRGSVVKNLPVNERDAGLTLGWEDPLEKEMDPLQYSCLGNSMDRGAWWATVCRVAKSQTASTDQKAGSSNLSGRAKTHGKPRVFRGFCLFFSTFFVFAFFRDPDADPFQKNSRNRSLGADSAR